jgi:hypothetical protein
VSFIDGRANLKLQPCPPSGKLDIGADIAPGLLLMWVDGARSQQRGAIG